MLQVGSLCSGYGGLEMGLSMVVPTELAWVSEIEPAPCAVLAARYPGVPNLGDMTTVDWSMVEPVDMVTAGWPCQPFSHAGKRQGADDDRHLWPSVLECLRVLRPRYLIGENVAGHLSLGFGTVLGDLASIGFDAEWCVVRAADVGACHRRARLFVVAADAARLGPRLNGGARWPAAVRDETSREYSRCPTADTTGIGEPDQQPRGDAAALSFSTVSGTGHRVGERHPAAGTGKHQRGPEVVDWGSYAPAIARHEAVLTRPAPRPVDDAGRLSPVFVEWMQMLPEGWVTDIVPRRRAALKALGNGVVPLQAAHAIAGLLGRLSGAQERRGGQAVDVGPLLPTPAAGNFNDGEDVESWQRRRAEQAAMGRNGNGFGTPLSMAVRMLAEDRP